MRLVRTILAGVTWLMAGTMPFVLPVEMGQLQAAAPVRIVAHGAFPLNELTIEELKAIYLFKRTQLPNGGRIEPVMPREVAVQEQFAEQYMGKTALALESFYRSRVFSGAGLAPRAFGSEAALLEYVAKTPGAIGFVVGSSVPSGVKVLMVRSSNP